MSDTDTKPKPGSDEAIKAGCRCPVLDNGHGRGHLGDGDKYGWWMSADCPLHGKEIKAIMEMREGTVRD